MKQKTRAKAGPDTHDDANRLSSTGYAYDGAGRRIRQMVGANTTNYLLDVSMGLWETLTAMTGANVNRYVHDPRGLLSQHDGASWDWMLADDLGSVRNVVDGGANVLWSSHYAPYDSPFGGTGSAQTAYGFTGEPSDGNGLVYLRNRYYAPGIGVFANVDPLETANRYAYVGGNVVNAKDPSGLLVNPGSCPSGQQRNADGRCEPIPVPTSNSDWLRGVYNPPITQCPRGQTRNAVG